MENNIKEIYLKGLEKRKNAGFSTGLDDLDIFCKYLEAGNIMTIGGRPSMGKTNFAITLVNHLVNIRKNVLFISLEHSKEQIVQRLVAEKIGTPLFRLLDGNVREEEVEIILNSYKDKSLEIVDKTNLSIEDIETKIQETKPDIVFVDYVQLVEAPKAPNLTEAINLVIKEIKRIAVDNNVIVVLVSQLSRTVEGRINKHPMLSDLRNGSLLEEISDVILFLYRDEYYDSEAENPINEIIIAKNSTGLTGVVTLDFRNGFFRNPAINNTF